MTVDLDRADRDRERVTIAEPQRGRLRIVGRRSEVIVARGRESQHRGLRGDGVAEAHGDLKTQEPATSISRSSTTTIASNRLSDVIRRSGSKPT
jgi:hypothetical protein